MSQVGNNTKLMSFVWMDSGDLPNCFVAMCDHQHFYDLINRYLVVYIENCGNEKKDIESDPYCGVNSCNLLD